jgi:hypothetical protein
MTRDDIIRLAREAATEDGSVNRSDGKNIVIYAAKTSLFLERFAALVAERDTALLRQALEALEYEARRGNDDAYRSLRDALSERLGEKT